MATDSIYKSLYIKVPLIIRSNLAKKGKTLYIYK